MADRILTILKITNLALFVVLLTNALAFGYLLVTEQPETREVTAEEYYAIQKIPIHPIQIDTGRIYTVWVTPPSKNLQILDSMLKPVALLFIGVALISAIYKGKKEGIPGIWDPPITPVAEPSPSEDR
jgi:hypothetical protein